MVALTESLRRELDGTGVRALHVVTPGVNTEMLDATEEVYGRYMDTSGWDKVEPGEWADKVLDEKVDRRPRRATGGGEARLARAGVPGRRDQRPDVQPAAAALATGGASASASMPASGWRARSARARSGAREARLAVAEVHPPQAAEATS